MSRRWIVGGAAALLAPTAFLSAAPALAHEQRQVGAYQFTVGWQHEPTYTGLLNSVQIFIHDAKGNPIDDIGSPPTLRVVVSTGAQTSDPLDLHASFDPDTGLGTHGEFDAAIIPTSPGTYLFHITGTLGGQQISEQFTSSDKTFDSVEDPDKVEFPNKLPNTADLATNLGRLTPRVQKALDTGQRAHDKANSASALALVALIVVGLLGVTGTVLGLARRRATG